MKKKYITIKKAAEFKDIGNKGSKFYSHSLTLIAKSSPQKYFSQDKNIYKNARNQLLLSVKIKAEEDSNSLIPLNQINSLEEEKQINDLDSSVKKFVKNQQKKSVKIIKINPDICRVGFTVSKKISKSSVKRNKIKRRLKDCFDKLSSDFTESKKDYLIIAKKEILEFEFEKIFQDMKYCFKNILKNSHKK